MRLRTATSLVASMALMTVPLTAQAVAGEAPTVTIAHLSGNPGVLVATATAADESTVSSVVAEVTGGGSPAVQAKLTYHEATKTWRSDQRKLPAYGEYQIAVVATDEDGDTNATPATAVLPYLKQPVVVAHEVTPTALDVTHPLTVARGDIHVLDPRTGETEPAAGGTVEARWAGADQAPTPATIDDEGHYVLKLPPQQPVNGAKTALTVSLKPQPDTAPLEATPHDEPHLDQVDVSTTVAAAKVAMNVPKVSVRYPAKLTIAGRVQVGSTPVPGATLQASFKGKPLPSVVTAGADGRFALTLTPRHDGAYSFRWQPTEQQAPYVSTASATGVTTVSVSDRTHLTFVKPAIDREAMMHIESRLTTSSGALAPKGSKVWLQRSSTGKGGWVSVGYLPTSYSGYVKMQGWLPHPSGYYRLQYYGGTGLQPTTSWVWRSPRRETRVIKLNAAPEPVRKGARVTVSGVVQRLGTSWTGIGKGQDVQVFFRPKGASPTTNFTYQGSAWTSATGAFTFKGKAVRDGDWTAAWFSPSQWYVNAYALTDAVDVR